jgi:hypothetical protein
MYAKSKLEVSVRNKLFSKTNVTQARYFKDANFGN